MTIKELAQEVSVDDRTIRRDLNALRKANFPLEERVTAHGCKHWKIIDGGANVPIHFNWSEAVALYLGRRLLDPLAGTNFWQSANSAFSKIRAMLGEAALAQLGKVEKTFLQTMPGVSDYSEKAELIDLLMLAIEDHKIAWVAYQEKTWHPSQKLTKEKDGSVVLEVSLNDTHEIKAWTLSFGPKATVLEPESLRDEIVNDVEQLLKSYQTSNRRVS